MATLNSKVQAFIVKGFARFMSSKEIIEAVKNKFGLELTYQQVGFYDYDPSDDESKLGKQWQELFLKERKKAENDESNVPVSHRAFRIKLLYKMIEKAMNSGNMVLAADLLKQVAEEMGGKYTNQQKVNSKVEQTGEMNHKHSIDLPQNIADLNAQELAKLYFAKS